ncbi:unnamed protein product [Rotaria sp. Silwood2]|nr:unnamed protein product [Rotaria sp. Silwood2]CAF2870989.1 unnamed protein product [Rotaria sp. Silwood2]CAF3065717.1 unnamed protein product [Rotaria sp. Silwood2]CAF3299070.1 unnamed protein product [Rotaria sp. Silwood2]CAF4024219.1 unnamed protein product [Rotaria sp. Silwood2]
MPSEKYLYILGSVAGILILIINLVLVSMIYVKVQQRQQSQDLPNNDLFPLDCPILILGAGFGGSNVAYRLAPKYKNDLCIIERENYVGGKLHDVNFKGETVQAFETSIVPLSAIRFYKSQPVLVQLANELNITSSSYAFRSSLIKSRGNVYSQYNHMCNSSYKNLNCTDDANGVNSADQLWLAMLNQYRTFPDSLSHFADLAAFARSLIGDEATEYLRDTFLFQGDFENTHPKAYMEFFNQEWNLHGESLFPHGGMSQFPIRMILNATTQFNVRLYPNEEVSSIGDYIVNDNHGFLFSVETTRYKIRAKQIVCAIDPVNLKNIRGSVAQAIKATLHFQAILPVKIVTIQNYWPSRWWEVTKLVLPLGSVDRAWTRQNCINSVVLSVQRPADRDRNLTRSVLADGSCVSVWEEYIRRTSCDDLIEEIRRGLQAIFLDVNIPRPTKTFYKVWLGGWHFQQPHSTFTNQDIATWALHPLSRFNRDALTMVGEAYYLNRAAWIDAAAKSALRALTSQFKMNFPCFDHDDAEGRFCATA